MVDDIVATPEFGDDSPAPLLQRRVRNKKYSIPTLEDYIDKTTPEDTPEATAEIKIEQMNSALKSYTESYKINIVNKKDPLIQLQSTRIAIGRHLKSILTSMKGFKFIETLEVTFKKLSYGLWVYKTAYFNSVARIIINDSEIDDSLQLSKQKILNIIAQWISEGSGWTIKSVDNHFLNIAKYQSLKRSSYIELPKELRNSAKGLINPKNNDNECFRWCHIRHLNPQDEKPQRIKKSDRQYINNLDYTGIEFPVTAVKHINKIENQNSININVFGWENKQPYPIYVS